MSFEDILKHKFDFSRIFPHTPDIRRLVLGANLDSISCYPSIKKKVLLVSLNNFYALLSYY